MAEMETLVNIFFYALLDNLNQLLWIIDVFFFSCTCTICRGILDCVEKFEGTIFLCCDREGLKSVGEIYSRKNDWLMRDSADTKQMQEESVYAKTDAFDEERKR